MGYTAGVTAVDRKVYPNHDRMTENKAKNVVTPRLTGVSAARK